MSERAGDSRAAWPLRAIVGTSETILAVERVAIVALMGGLTALILINVVTRYTGFPIYWIDESAVYTTVWLTFVGASAMSRLRLDFAVNLLTEKLGPDAARVVKVIATLVTVSFGLALILMCWLWMDPVGIASAGFDAQEFSGATFNFLYTERTQTLNWPSWLVYLVMPIFAVTLTIHGIANVLEDLGAVPIVDHSAFGVGSPDEIV